MRLFPVAPLAVLLALQAPRPAFAAPTKGPLLSLILESIYAQPGNALVREAAGPGLSAAFRLTDQLSIIGGGALLGSRAGHLTTFSFGLQATLDTTPVEPFLDLAVVRLGPPGSAGYTLATRTGGGADWHLSERFSLGLSVRTLTPLDGSLVVAGTEVALRFVVRPGAFR